MSSTPLITDSHCHFDFEALDPVRDQAMQRARDLGIGLIIVPGVGAESWPRVAEVCDRYTECYPAFGLHPYFIEQHREQDLQTLEHWLKEKRPIAVGECGLDFFLKDLDPDRQMHFFLAQLELAQQFDLPVIIHARKSTEQVIQCLKRFPGMRGMVHSYSGSFEQAEQLMKLGFYFSFGGAMTYERASRLRKVIARIPLQHLLLETDAPDQPGSRHQGEVNEPAYIDEVIEKMAALLNIDQVKLIEQTTINARQLFGLN
jgi:TatD DNase family protein